MPSLEVGAQKGVQQSLPPCAVPTAKTYAIDLCEHNTMAHNDNPHIPDSYRNSDRAGL